MVKIVQCLVAFCEWTVAVPLEQPRPLEHVHVRNPHLTISAYKVNGDAERVTDFFLYFDGHSTASGSTVIYYDDADNAGSVTGKYRLFMNYPGAPLLCASLEGFTHRFKPTFLHTYYKMRVIEECDG